MNFSFNLAPSVSYSGRGGGAGPPQTVPVLGLGPIHEVLLALRDPYLWESLLASRRKKSVMRRRSRTRSPWWRRLAIGCLHWLTQHMQTWQVIYDPDWDVYYDPETHEYFELIEEAISGPQAAGFFCIRFHFWYGNQSQIAGHGSATDNKSFDHLPQELQK